MKYLRQGFPNLLFMGILFGYLSIRSCTPKILTYYSAKKKNALNQPRNLNGILSLNLYNMLSTRLPYNLSIEVLVVMYPLKCRNVPQFGNL